MKKLSDYKDEEAIELWADLIDPLSALFADEDIKNVVTSKGSNAMEIAKVIIKNHKKEISQIMLRIDPTPITGLNIVTRLIELLAEIGENDEVKAFFGFAEQAKTDAGFSGSLMEITEGAEA